MDESKWKRRVEVIVNQTVTFGCPVVGTPDPEINWLANGQLLERGTTAREISLSENKKEVRIKHFLYLKYDFSNST